MLRCTGMFTYPAKNSGTVRAHRLIGPRDNEEADGDGTIRSIYKTVTRRKHDKINIH